MPGACNYDQTAFIEDGSCEYPSIRIELPGQCLQDEDEDGVCDALEVSGCTGLAAMNFDDEVTGEQRHV